MGPDLLLKKVKNVKNSKLILRVSQHQFFKYFFDISWNLTKTFFGNLLILLTLLKAVVVKILLREK